MTRATGASARPKDAQNIMWPRQRPPFKKGLARSARGITPHIMHDLEEKIAHLTRTVDDLSDIVARQSREIDVLTRRVAMLLQREAEREAEGGVIIGDERPPHY